MRTRLLLIPLLLIGAALAMAAGSSRLQEPQYTSNFGLTPRDILRPEGGNPYFPLRPGTVLRYEGEEEGEFVELEITVLEQTRLVPFQVDGQWVVATTRVVEEREWIDGELAELSLNYFAYSSSSGGVFHLGEDVEIYEEGQPISNEGSWLAGQDGAKPGLMMPGVFLLGSRYYQELAPGVAMDRARHVGMGLEVETPAGVFEDCVMVLDTTPLEPDEETTKIYASGVGLIVDGALELVDFDRIEIDE
ncbi:MAG: hypothetical protein ACYS0G_00310 [Planctomycetota bacterium]